MKNPALWICISIVMVTLATTGPCTADSWDSVYQSDNLRVDSRAHAGSQLQEMRGVVRVQTSLNALMALLKDADFNPQWVYRSGGAKILQEESYAQAYVYGVVDAPWPMQDRDTIVRFDYLQNPDTKEITVTINNVPEFIPAKAELVRVPEFGGYWRLRPEEDGWVEVTYLVYGDPGGWIPVWLANRAAEVSVQFTLQNMISAVKHYADARSVFVEEPTPR